MKTFNFGKTSPGNQKYNHTRRENNTKLVLNNLSPHYLSAVFKNS